MRKFFVILFSFGVLLLAAFIIWLSLAFFFKPINTTKNPIVFVIPKKATVAQIAAELETKSTIHSVYYFLLFAKWLGQLEHIKAGEYQVEPNATLWSSIKKLEKGQVLLHKITFPEGWTFQQFLTKLAAESSITHTLAGLSHQDVMTAIGHPHEYPEGLFYPDTYLFTLATKDTQILRLSYDLMQKKLQQAWLNRASNLPYQTVYDALIVASLIEKEVQVPSERSVIAGIILQRLKMRMRLQIDASVIYGVEDKNRFVLTKTDLMTDTPYNTYTRYGLPPTPIAMPGIASIHAALHPTFGTAIYYVAKGDGTHVFSDTLQAHRIAVQAYRQYKRDLIVTLPQCFSAQLMQHYWTSL